LIYSCYSLHHKHEAVFNLCFVSQLDLASWCMKGGLSITPSFYLEEVALLSRINLSGMGSNGMQNLAKMFWGTWEFPSHWSMQGTWLSILLHWCSYPERNCMLSTSVCTQCLYGISLEDRNAVRF
jgi:hypothetical protein